MRNVIKAYLRQNRFVSNIVLLLTLVLFLNSCKKEAVVVQEQPAEVVYELVEERDINLSREFVARVKSTSSIDLRPRVQGVLMEKHFKVGEKVKKGDLLYVIEKDTYQIAVDRSKADYKSSQAKLKLAEITYKRMKELYNKKAVAQQDFDNASADLDSAKANVDLRKAELDDAELHLDWCEIRSPIDGFPGIRRYDVGNLISPNSGVLLNVISNDIMEVNFSVEEGVIVRSVRKLLNDPQKKDSSSENIKAYLTLPDGSKYEHEGYIAYGDNRIHESTGTFQMTAKVDNPEGYLRDGMYVKILLIFENSKPAEELKKSIIVKQSAVMQDQAGHYVIVINDKNIAEVRRVKYERSYENFFIIDEGLIPGDKVVTLGLQMIVPGNEVKGLEATNDIENLKVAE